MCDAVGDDPGFSATGSGQYQQGAFGVLDRLPLAGVQPLKKIHESFILPRVAPYPQLRVLVPLLLFRYITGRRSSPITTRYGLVKFNNLKTIRSMFPKTS